MSKNPYLSEDLNDVAAAIVNWRAEKGFETNLKNCPEKLMLVVTELSEAMEAFRHLEERTLNYCQHKGVDAITSEDVSVEQWDWLHNFTEEFADTFIRLLDMTGSFGIDIATAIMMKMAKNEERPHKHGKEC